MIRNDAELSETFGLFHPGLAFKLDAEFQRYFVTRMLEGNVDRMFFLPHNKEYVFSNLFDVINYK